MAHITDLGPHFYAQKLWWHTENPPLAYVTHTTETEPPYRLGKCVVLRLPFTKRALALGAWVGEAEHEEDALLRSMDARVTRSNGVVLDEEVDW